MTDFASELEALQRIAVFSAKARGHDLGEWQIGADFAVASCVRCRSEIRVCFSVVQPEMAGRVPENPCRQASAACFLPCQREQAVNSPGHTERDLGPSSPATAVLSICLDTSSSSLLRRVRPPRS